MRVRLDQTFAIERVSVDGPRSEREHGRTVENCELAQFHGEGADAGRLWRGGEDVEHAQGHRTLRGLRGGVKAAQHVTHDVLVASSARGLELD